MKKLFPLLAVFLLSACMSQSLQKESQKSGHMGMMNQSEGGSFSREVAGLPEVEAMQVVELKDGDSYDLTADLVKQTVGNRVLKRLAYNRQIPGPILKVPQGASITINFTNQTDVDTTIHSHGIRLDNKFDGVPDVTQKPIKPGESFTYEITFPDAGVYWYHPHIREDYTQELGLYGNYLISAHDENYWSSVDREEVLLLDDILLDSEGIVDFESNSTNHTLMGRFGNVMLINNEEDYTLSAQTGEVLRLFVTNVANTRTFQLAIPGVKMKLVGGDAGRIEQEEWVESVIIAPSERVVLEVVFADQGEYTIEHQTPKKTYQIGNVSVQAGNDNTDDFSTLRHNPSDYQSVRADFAEILEQEPDKKLRLDIEMKMMGGMGEMNGMGGMMHHEDDDIDWEDDMAMMNQMSDSENTTWKLIDEQTGLENMDINWKFKVGDMVKIRIFNDPDSAHPMQHPIHFHGQRFVVLSRNGIANDNLQWKDTTLIPKGETADILLEISNPGTWMAHCHIAEHLHAGMMFGFEVK